MSERLPLNLVKMGSAVFKSCSNRDKFNVYKFITIGFVIYISSPDISH